MLFASDAMAQFSTEAARQELERRGLTEQEVREALILKGVNVDNINTSDPAELKRYEKTIREVLDELERKKIEASQPNSNIQPQQTSGSTQDVQEAIKDEGVKEAIKEGATIDEAISEELQKKQEEITPPAVIYGHQLFRNKTLKLFRTTDGAKVPATYSLGPGDVVSIAVWGDTEFSLNQEITKEGFIKPERIPRIFLSGYTIEEAKAIIYKKLRGYMVFNKSEMALSLVTARTININIVGDVFNPGSYNISAINSGVNALVAAGGPNNLGSVRRIKLLSPGAGERNIDLYRYLLNPLVNEDYYLSENDYLFVPIAEKVVEIRGAVNRPFKYELLEEENLIDLVNFAGGLQPDAITKNIQISRIFDDERIIIDIDYTKAKSTDFSLKHGDRIEVRAIGDNVDNTIKIEGAVQNAGIYEYQEGMRIVEVLDKAILEDDAITDLVYIRRLNDDFKTRRYEIVNIEAAINNPQSPSNLELNKGDIIIISSAGTFADKATIQIVGAVRDPKEIELDVNNNLKISDALFLGGGISKDAANFGYIYRKGKDNPSEIEYIYFDINEVLTDGAGNYELNPDDRIEIFKKSTFQDDAIVSVSGAVRNPGEFVYNENLTLRDALLFSGGLKREASNSRIEVYRLEIGSDKSANTLVATVSADEDKNFEQSRGFGLMPFDQIIVRSAPDFEYQQNVELAGEVLYPGMYALLVDNTRLSYLVKQAGNLSEEAFLGGATLYRSYDNTGYIVIDLEKALSNPGSKYDLILRKGDKLTIPKRSTLVTISGATNSKAYYPEKLTDGKINVSYEGSKRAHHYINKYAGGLSENADRRSVSVEYPNGEVKTTKRILFFNVHPKVREGSHIKVAYKVEKTKEEKKKKILIGAKYYQTPLPKPLQFYPLFYF